ncbi:hypothetical protein OKA05_09085 [Luteolibacter arcticus]|uniref:Uncharacterized protein n=1 Tax=Luteolibacter arcticus TaxID=1581411 RepID=A0ABT3GGH0_9BACT|nr:hypothetical protein [Luteolibacter arcticus]MCW1922706.1 hypothetical protein [Luteolibacter arcticus]
MFPAIHPTCNFTLGPAPGDEGSVGKLPVHIHARGVASFWLPTPAEIYAINRGEALVVSLALDPGKTPFPPMAVGIFADMFDAPGTETISTDPVGPSVVLAQNGQPFDVAVMVNGPRSEVVR